MCPVECSRFAHQMSHKRTQKIEWTPRERMRDAQIQKEREREEERERKSEAKSMKIFFRF